MELYQYVVRRLLLAEKCVPYLKDGQIITIFPGNAGSLIFRKVFQEKALEKDIKVVDTYTLPYACRKRGGPGTIDIHSVTGSAKNPAAALPGENTNAALTELNDIYPEFTPMDNVLEIALLNPNMLVHPIGTILNLGRIEFSNGNFWLYKEGFTKSTWKLLHAIDKEKVNILKKLGLHASPYLEFRKEIGADPWEEFAEVSSRGPLGAKDRYITEDVPIALVFMASLGDMVGVPTPTTRAIIRIFSEINQTDYFAEGRTVEKCGVVGKSQEELLKYVRRGD